MHRSEVSYLYSHSLSSLVNRTVVLSIRLRYGYPESTIHRFVLVVLGHTELDLNSSHRLMSWMHEVCEYYFPSSYCCPIELTSNIKGQDEVGHAI